MRKLKRTLSQETWRCKPYLQYGTCTCYDCDHGSGNRWCNHCICCEPDNPVVSGQTSTWSNPVVNVWAAGATVDNHDAGNANISQWGDGGKEKPKLAYEESSRLYYVDVQSSEWTGFQFVDAGSTETAAPEIKTEGAAIEQIKTLLLIQAFIVYWMTMEISVV